MGSGLSKLSAARVAKCSQPGYLIDGGGLYLQVARRTAKKSSDKKRPAIAEVTKSWVFRYRDRVNHVKVHELGLGPYPDVSLEEAREKAADLRGMLRHGADPKVERDSRRAAIKAAAARGLTFDQAAATCIKDKRAGWKNEKHASQWENTLATYVSPVIGSLPVESIDLAMVRKVLDPIWNTKNETASRVRQRMEAVLAWATVSGYRQGDNPARWKNHLDHLLAPPSKVKKVKHQPALPYSQIGAFMDALRERTGIAPLALEFAILTGGRAEEILLATAKEFDLQRSIWTIPGERMKASKDHTVPLSPRALEIVKLMSQKKDAPFLFPGEKEGKGLSDGTMLKVVKLMHAKSMKDGAKGWLDPSDGRRIVPHGFRSTFRDWAGEQTNFPREIIEHALAHQLKDKAEAAYSRSTMPEKRRKLMDAWAQYCATKESGAAGRIRSLDPVKRTAS